MAIHQLELAPVKTEAVVLHGLWKKQQTESPRFMLRGMEIRLSRAVRYFDIILDDIGSFENYISISIMYYVGYRVLLL